MAATSMTASAQKIDFNLNDQAKSYADAIKTVNASIDESDIVKREFFTLDGKQVNAVLDRTAVHMMKTTDSKGHTQTYKVIGK